MDIYRSWCVVGKASDLVFVLREMVLCRVVCDQSTALLGTATGTTCHRAATGSKREEGSQGRGEQLLECLRLLQPAKGDDTFEP